MNKSFFFDSDVLAKIGEYSNNIYLRKILLSFGSDLYISEYVLSEELKLFVGTYKTISKMVFDGEITKVQKSDLSLYQEAAYTTAFNALRKELELDESNPRGKNRGEVDTLSLAHALNADILVSDDRDARIAKDKCGIQVRIIRYIDVIVHIKNNSESLEIERKTAKQMFLYPFNKKFAGNEKDKKRLHKYMKNAKTRFDKAWPV